MTEPPAQQPDIILSLDVQDRQGIPLALAGWLMEQLGEAFPHCTAGADARGAAMAIRISQEDFRHWLLERDHELDRRIGL